MPLRILRELGVAFGVTLTLLLPVYLSGAMPPTVVVTALILAVPGAAILAERAGRCGHVAGLGVANRVTLARAVLALPILALVFHPDAVDATARWWAVALALTVLALDGLDGWVARRTGTVSAFGARFDMELDAVLLLALSALVWHSGQAGAWVLLIGAMRYGFVAAGWLIPALTAPLPEAFRRKAACVVQGGALVVCLLPPVSVAMATTVAAGALALLVWSFAVDVYWLLGNAE